MEFDAIKEFGEHPIKRILRCHAKNKFFKTSFLMQKQIHCLKHTLVETKVEVVSDSFLVGFIHSPSNSEL
jgi:hypothetical protein